MVDLTQCVCYDHTGKMTGIHSLSTSVILNLFCQNNQKNKESICSHCYAESMAQMYTDLAKKLVRNTEILCSRILDNEELLDTTGDEIFRFESFGDLNNEVQLINYMNIVEKNPNTRFTLYTKRYDLVCKYFDGKTPPENFTLVLSSMLINKELNLETFRKRGLGNFAKGQLKIFTVYDADYIRKNMDTVNINCGSRACNKCRACYNKNTIEHIHEILKSDQTPILKFEMNFNDDEKRPEIIEYFENNMNSLNETEEEK